MIEIEHSETFFLDEKALIIEGNLTKNSTDEKILQCVECYIACLDDYDYYSLSEHTREITEKLKNFLKNT